MDDTQDKVRRNLVVFSSIIIIVWFLELKISTLLTYFYNTDLTFSNPFRIWLVIFTILIYLYLRFWFDKETNSQIDNLIFEKEKFRQFYINVYLSKVIKHINRFKKFNSLLNVFSDSLETAVSEKINDLKTNLPICKWLLNIDINWKPETLVDPSLKDRKWSGYVSVVELYFDDNYSKNIPFITREDSHQFYFNFIARFWVLIHLYSKLITFSKSSIDLIIPIFLSIIALFITVCNLISLYS